LRIALIAPPFIPVPPKRYGGTELFLATLACGLKKLGHEIVLYANGESEIPCEVRSIYAKAHWPINGDFSETLKEINHTSWAIRSAAEDCEIIHVNSVFGLAPSRFIDVPFVYTIHHEHEPALSDFYSSFPTVSYVTISKFQQTQERLPKVSTIHHGIDLNSYRFQERKQAYLTFLGRLVPIKGAHVAIAVAKQSGIPLKIAGEIQPMFQDYYDNEVKPHIDGRFIEYVGEVDLEAKNQLLESSLALLFPVQWNEPFGLVMIEAMACGTPVLALPGGSVEEVVVDGISGYVCSSVEEMVGHAREVETWIQPSAIRQYVERHFSMERMASDYAELYSGILRGSKPLQEAPPSDTGDRGAAA